MLHLRQAELLLGDAHQQVGADRRAHLQQHVVLTAAQKRPQLRALFDPFEEQFHLPAPPVKFGHGHDGQAERLGHPALRRRALSLVRWFERDLARVEDLLRQLRDRASALDQRVQKLEAITGGGALTSWACWPNCPNWARSTVDRPRRWPDWPRTPGRAACGKDSFTARKR